VFEEFLPKQICCKQQRTTNQTHGAIGK